MPDARLGLGPNVAVPDEAHVLVARCLLALARTLVLAEAGHLDSPEAWALARLASETARGAADVSGKAADLLIGRSSLQLHGEALHAPSWVYDAAWSIAARLTPGSFCALYLPGSIEPHDVLELARAGAPGPSTRIRAFGLPSHFAALVEAQGRDPGELERGAVLVVGIRRQLAVARDKDHGSAQVWVSLARSVVEACERKPTWVPLGRYPALAVEDESWLVADAARLAGCMTIASSRDRRDSCDAALAVLLVAARRARVKGPVARPDGRDDDVQRWVLSATDVEQIPPTCVGLLGELKHLADDSEQATDFEPRARSVLGRIVESSWWFASRVAATQQEPERLVAVLGERASAVDGVAGDVLRLLVACVGSTPQPDAQTGPLSEAPPGSIPPAEATTERAPQPFTDDELDSFLDEFVAWGGAGKKP